MIAFVGAGKVGTALGLYFKAKGFEIQGYYSRNYEHAKQASIITGTKAYPDLEQLINDSRMIWITTSDDAIKDVTSQISELTFENNEKKLFLHASGVYSTDILQPLKKHGYSIASAHPLLAFSDSKSTIKKLDDTWFTLEIDNNSENQLEDFFHKTGNPVLKIDGKQKILYHAACSMLSNYLVTLMDSSYNVFEKTGLEKEAIKKATLPLLESVIANSIEKEGKDALTGPIKRGDKNTVSLHLQQIQKEIPESFELYRTLGRETMKMLNDFRLKDIIN